MVNEGNDGECFFQSYVKYMHYQCRVGNLASVTIYHGMERKD